MEAGHLYRLIRQLRTVAGAANRAGTRSTSPSAGAVLADLTAHPDSSITEIAARTGLVQSMVSTAVARLRTDGVLHTAPDPRDRRRTVVSLARSARLEPRPCTENTVDDALRHLRPELDEERRAEVVRHLEQAAALLNG